VNLGHLERDVMGCLWAAHRPLTVREVHEALSAERAVAYTTVMTVLQRLAKKRVALQTRDGKAHLYSAAESREQLAAELMMDALGEVDGKAARETALLHFVGRMSPGEAEIFRAALAATPSARVPTDLSDPAVSKVDVVVPARIAPEISEQNHVFEASEHAATDDEADPDRGGPSSQESLVRPSPPNSDRVTGPAPGRRRS
jgi:predicted transcriptional regulator